tara:strand:- start:124 stop:339 length:216 start_codon:yes stop_codon:yes gene_type:complete
MCVWLAEGRAGGKRRRAGDAPATLSGKVHALFQFSRGSDLKATPKRPQRDREATGGQDGAGGYEQEQGARE